MPIDTPNSHPGYYEGAMFRIACLEACPRRQGGEKATAAICALGAEAERYLKTTRIPLDGRGKRNFRRRIERGVKRALKLPVDPEAKEPLVRDPAFGEILITIFQDALALNLNRISNPERIMRAIAERKARASEKLEA